MPTAADIMSRPVRFVDADTSVADALVAAQRYGHSGISVKEGGRVVGIVARRDLDKAIRHGLGHAPVKGVMTRNVVFARESTTVEELRRLMVDTQRRAAAHRGRRGLRACRSGTAGWPWTTWWASPPARTCWPRTRGAGRRSRARLPRLRSAPCRPLADIPFFGRIFREALGPLGRLRRRVPRRRLRPGPAAGPPNVDVDIAVEGDGIEFARRLAARPGRAGARPPEVPDRRGAPAAGDPGGGARVAACRAASRSTWTWPPPAPSSTTTPPRSPRVEHASIRQDLFRRDFTINAMAVSLKGGDFGTVIDFFGGSARPATTGSSGCCTT